jgi:hypothetical protein
MGRKVQNVAHTLDRRSSAFGSGGRLFFLGITSGLWAPETCPEDNKDRLAADSTILRKQMA